MIKMLVVIYGLDFDGARTMRALQAQKENLRARFSIYLWNNGPRSLMDAISESETIQDISSVGVEVTVLEDLSNPPLGLIYNYFCDGAEQVVLLDQDTVIDELYLKALEEFASSNAEVFLPAIRVNGELHYPVSSPHQLIDSRGPVYLDKCYSIASGMSIKKAALESIEGGFGTVFDERFVFYGVDTSFFERYTRSGRRLYFVGPDLKHGLSRIEEDWSSDNFKFRERLFDICLQARIFPTFKRILYLMKFVLTSRPRSVRREGIGAARCLIFARHPRFRSDRTLHFSTTTFSD